MSQCLEQLNFFHYLISIIKKPKISKLKGKKFSFKPLRIFNDIEIVVLTFAIIRMKFPQLHFQRLSFTAVPYDYSEL